MTTPQQQVLRFKYTVESCFTFNNFRLKHVIKQKFQMEYAWEGLILNDYEIGTERRKKNNKLIYSLEIQSISFILVITFLQRKIMLILQ